MYLAVLEASSGQLVSGGAGGRPLVSGSRHRIAKKNSCDDPFETVPGSIPSSCIPAFTGTQIGGCRRDIYTKLQLTFAFGENSCKCFMWVRIAVNASVDRRQSIAEEIFTSSYELTK